MSVSTPVNPPPQPDRPRNRRNNARAEMTLSERTTRMSPQAWAVSITAHVVIFGLAIWLTPARQMIESLVGGKESSTKQSPSDPTKNPETPEQQADQEEKERAAEDPERVKDVIQNIEDKQTETAADMVAQQLSAEKDINDQLQKSLEDYNKMAADQAVKAPDDVLKAVQTVTQQQDAAMQAQTTLLGQIKEVIQKAPDVQNAADATALNTALAAVAQINADAAKSRDAIKASQIAAQNSQTEAKQKLDFTGLKSSIDAQQQANDAQNAASDAQDQTSNAQGQLVDLLNKYSRGMFGLNDLLAQIAKLKAQIDWRINTDVPAHQKAADDAQAKMAGFKKDLQAAKDAHSSDPNVLGNAQFHVDEEQKEINQTQENLKYAKDYIGGDQWQLSQLEAQLKDIQDGVNDAKQNLPSLLGKAEADQQNAQNLQSDAKNKQLAAQDKITSDLKGADPAALAKGAQADISKYVTAVPSADSLKGKGLADLYKAAGEAEGRLTEKYQALRGAELAQIRNITLGEAIKETQVAKPDREKLDTKLLSGDGADKDIEGYKEVVTKAKGQMSSMVSLSEDILASAEAQGKTGKDDVDASDWMKNGGADLEAMATADDSGDNVGADLAKAMEDASKLKGDEGGKASTGTPNPLNLQGPGNGIATFGLHGFPRSAPELPGMDYASLKPYATRRIGAQGTHYNDWLYVDSWYLIGPFPNPGRRNINTKFPPESVVDLNAVYKGKNDQSIRWNFIQTAGPELRPPNDIEDAPAIYYAYTEVILDEPRDLWIATGSDDKGTMWINGFLVWNSGNTLKSWEANEGYRKVHFNKGLNKVLYRLENAWREAGLSLMISTKQN